MSEVIKEAEEILEAKIIKSPLSAEETEKMRSQSLKSKEKEEKEKSKALANEMLPEFLELFTDAVSNYANGSCNFICVNTDKLTKYDKITHIGRNINKKLLKNLIDLTLNLNKDYKFYEYSNVEPDGTTHYINSERFIYFQTKNWFERLFN